MFLLKVYRRRRISEVIYYTRIFLDTALHLSSNNIYLSDIILDLPGIILSLFGINFELPGTIPYPHMMLYKIIPEGKFLELVYLLSCVNPRINTFDTGYIHYAY